MTMGRGSREGKMMMVTLKTGSSSRSRCFDSSIPRFCLKSHMLISRCVRVERIPVNS